MESSSRNPTGGERSCRDESGSEPCCPPLRTPPRARSRLDLPPGTYTLTGTSPLYGKGTRRTTEATITVLAGVGAEADVICTER